MPSELYEILAQGASYWFAFLGIVIVWRSFAWLRKDGRLRRKRVRQLPDAGFVGELVVLAGNEQLPEGSLLPLPQEGVLGSLRGCDVVVPEEGVAGKHLTFRFIRGKGLYIEPWLHQTVWVDGEEYGHRGKPPLMYHGSRLQVGEAHLRLRLFMGVETARSARRYEEPEPLEISRDWREQTLTHHQAVQPWQEYEEAPYEDEPVYEDEPLYQEEPRRGLFNRRR
ncbi:MAG: FHA domain-containing protein [Clostridia bacterium]|nr:FHA domain-containing protein [Clostridia bacterium]